MKKLLSIVAIVVAVTAVAAEKTVATVGVTAITSSKQHTIVSVPYTELGTGGNICVSNLIKTANLDLGDIVYVFSGTQYNGWVLASSGDVKYWSPLTNVTPKDGVTVGVPAGDETMVAGTAIWLVKATAPSSAFTFYVYGKAYESAPSTQILVGNNLVANPCQATANFVFANATDGDTITVPNDYGAPTIYTYKNSKWYTKGESRFDLPVEHKPALDAGHGFWYKAQTAGTMTWTTGS